MPETDQNPGTDEILTFDTICSELEDAVDVIACEGLSLSTRDGAISRLVEFACAHLGKFKDEPDMKNNLIEIMAHRVRLVADDEMENEFLLSLAQQGFAILYNCEPTESLTASFGQSELPQPLLRVIAQTLNALHRTLNFSSDEIGRLEADAVKIMECSYREAQGDDQSGRIKNATDAFRGLYRVSFLQDDY